MAKIVTPVEGGRYSIRGGREAIVTRVEKRTGGVTLSMWGRRRNRPPTREPGTRHVWSAATFAAQAQDRLDWPQLDLIDALDRGRASRKEES